MKTVTMDKNSFILYTDYFEQIEMLTIEQRGVLLTALMLSQMGEELPEMESTTKMAFMFISADIRRNNEKYKRIIERRKEAGRKGGQAKQANLANLANATFAKHKENVNDNDNDKDKDNENVNDNEKDNVNDTLSPPNPLTGAESGSVVTPSLSEIRDYCTERNSNIDPEEFYDFYSSKGWLIGKTPMKDWKAAFRGWERNHKAKAEKDPYAEIDDWLRRRTEEDDQTGVFDNQQSY